MTTFSDFKIGDIVVRRWNRQIYYICHDIDASKWEFLIDHVKDQKVSKCKVAECYTNLRIATAEEIKQGFANEF